MHEGADESLRKICKYHQNVPQHYYLFHALVVLWPKQRKGNVLYNRGQFAAQLNDKSTKLRLKKESYSVKTVLYQGSKSIFDFRSTCATRCKLLRTQNFGRIDKDFRRIASNAWSAYTNRSEEYLTLQKERLRLFQYGPPILAGLNTTTTNKRIRILHTRV